MQWLQRDLHAISSLARRVPRSPKLLPLFGPQPLVHLGLELASQLLPVELGPVVGGNFSQAASKAASKS